MKHRKLLFIYGILFLGIHFSMYHAYQQSMETLRMYTHDYELETETNIIEIDLNTASAAQLAKIAGVSRATADRIIAYRNENGRFSDISELLAISGISDKLLQQIACYVYIDTVPETTSELYTTEYKNKPETESSTTIIEPSESIASSAYTDTATEPEMTLQTETEILFPLELNHASVEELCALPGIGEVTAQAIVEYRNAIGGFLNCQQLLDVYGIGEAKLSAILPYIYLETEYFTVTETETETETFEQTEPTEPYIETQPVIPVINLNTATKEELMLLPECDESLADEIIKLRDEDIHIFYNILEITLAEHVTTELFALWMDYLAVDDEGETQIPYVRPGLTQN